MQRTSLLAYTNEVEPTLQSREREIIKIFRENLTMDFTNRELLKELRIEDPSREINSVTPRVNRLRGEGKKNPYTLHPHIIESRKRPCRVTRRLAIAWQLNNENRIIQGVT